MGQKPVKGFTLTQPFHTSGPTWPLPTGDFHPPAFAHAGHTTARAGLSPGRPALWRNHL